MSMTRAAAILGCAMLLSGCSDPVADLAQCRLDYKGREVDCMTTKGYAFKYSAPCQEFSAVLEQCYERRGFSFASIANLRDLLK